MRNAKVIKTNGSGGTNSCKSFSDLPVDVIQHILTKLPTEDAAKMSTLSSQLEEIWNSIAVLKIYEDQFQERSLFIDFVDRTLLFQDPSSIKLFHLSCDVLSNASHINDWISAVMRANVKVLHLSLNQLESGYRLPSCLFNSQSLTTFHLDVPCILKLPSSVSFPCLKILKLVHVTFDDADSTQLLLSNPPLKELHIFKCVWTDTYRSITIHAPKLQRLSIVEFELSEPEIDVHIYCTSLKFFYYSSLVPTALFRIHCSSSPVKVKIQLRDSDVYWDHCNYIRYMLEEFRHAKLKDLSLLGYCLEAFERVEQVKVLPVFPNLTILKLDRVFIYPNSKPLLFLLSKCPFLTILELQFLESPPSELILCPVPSCFQSHLKNIIIDNFAKYLMPALRTLLKATDALEELIILWSCKSIETAEEKKEALQELQTSYPRINMKRAF